MNVRDLHTRREALRQRNATANESPIEKVLARLDAVRETGPGKWTARCPAHEDRSPSLSISEAEDGKVLLHCFAGCSFDDIVTAMGLTQADLFATKPNGKDYVPRAVAEKLSHAATVLLLAESDKEAGREQTVDDQQTVAAAEQALFDRNTDAGNAERLIREHADDLRFVPAWGWLAWDGRRWTPDEAEATRRAIRTAREILLEAAGIENRTEQAALVRWGLTSQNVGRIEAMLKLGRVHERIAARPEQFDGDPWLLNVANGTIDLRTGGLRPHQRGDLLMKIAPIEYDSAAECPMWGKFLHRVLNENAALVQYVARLAGYTLTGSVREQMFAFLFGLGANGKSVLLETMLALMGEYASVTPTSTLMLQRGVGIPNDVARLAGLRLVLCSEVAEGARLDEAKLKDMTGADTVTARYLHREFFTFKPEFKLWVRGNHKPVVRDTSDSIWRRVHLIPFTTTIPEGERDPELLGKLREELPGILAWAVRGCLAWQKDGLGTPLIVRQATRNYRRESDTLGAFLSQHCELDDQAEVGATALYRAYKEWADAGGEKEISQTAFGRAMSERGIGRAAGQPVRYVGIALREVRRDS